MNTFGETLNGPFFLVLRNGYRPSACLEASCLCFSLVSRFTRVSVCVSERVCVSVVCVHSCMCICMCVCRGEGHFLVSHML